jgi:uncharacterized protein (TIGR03086 family)
MPTAGPVDLLTRALDQLGALVAAVDPALADLPTPCRSWDVGTLVNHVIFDLDQFSAAARGERVSWDRAVPAVDGDWAAAFRAGAERLTAAWRAAGDPDRVVRLPIGEVPLSFVVYQQVAEFAVHAWDLATATRQPVTLDPEIAEAALAWARTALRPEFRGSEDTGKAFGPEQPAPAGAPPYDRLAAFFGRSVVA